MTEPVPSRDLPVIRDHRRQWRDCLYVYPVISRRARGLSVGVNLNPDKHCTFACVYCQVDRRTRRELHDVDMVALRRELRLALGEAASGRLWQEPRFVQTPVSMRRINDIAFSGDGEPTLLPDFDRAVELATEVRRELGRPELKLVVITNGSQLDQPPFARALPVLDANNGEVWAKLDAGTEDFFLRVNHPYPRMTLDHILRNIALVARGRAIVIQSMFFRLEGLSTPPAEIAAYCDNLRHILNGGGKIKLIQVYTIARVPSCASATAAGAPELDAIARQISQAVGGVPVETYHGGL